MSDSVCPARIREPPEVPGVGRADRRQVDHAGPADGVPPATLDRHPGNS